MPLRLPTFGRLELWRKVTFARNVMRSLLFLVLFDLTSYVLEKHVSHSEEAQWLQSRRKRERKK